MTLSVRTGPDGRFVVPGIPLGAEVELAARHHGFRSLAPKPTRVGEATILRLGNSACVAMEGRILDAAGRPLPGANVHLRSRSHTRPMGHDVDDEIVVFEGGLVLVTDAAGRFRTPTELEVDREYTAYADAPGHHFNRTGWTWSHIRSFPDLRLSAIAVSK